MAAAHQSERGFGGAEDAHVVVGWRGAGERAGMGFRVVLVRAGDDDAR